MMVETMSTIRRKYDGYRKSKIFLGTPHFHRQLNLSCPPSVRSILLISMSALRARKPAKAEAGKQEVPRISTKPIRTAHQEELIVRASVPRC